jgi:hypothetical protein
MAEQTSKTIELLDALWAVMTGDAELGPQIKPANRLRPDRGRPAVRQQTKAPADVSLEVTLVPGRFRDADDPRVVTFCGRRRTRDQDYVLTVVGDTGRMPAVQWAAMRAIDLFMAASTLRPPFGLAYVERLLDVSGTSEETKKGPAGGTLRPVATATIAVRLILSDGVS